MSWVQSRSYRIMGRFVAFVALACEVVEERGVERAEEGE